MVRRMSFDWKAMGAAAYVPVVTLLGLIAFFFISPYRGETVSAITFVEILVPIQMSWWSIFLLQEYLQEEGGETLFSYPMSRMKIGFLRIFTFWILFMLMLTLFLGGMSYIYGENYFLSMFVQISYQSFFYTWFAFLVMVFLKNTTWAIGIVFAYATTQILTNGNLISFINVYEFNMKLIPVNQLVDPAIHAILLGVVCLIFAQWELNRLERYS
ncbi:hypothetical protein [Hazenella coriacea]|uniref:ABC-2 type transport system permease protein n=1 Tax=Hazenella coriacea TaxID=1179467 RepID=A0A4R3LAZ3_9BACL|nr:hypothetical protein [Hazenella coriacea]TCS96882.1 hypothetical protein EDD58_101527 [Hazenella coriacea]